MIKIETIENGYLITETHNEKDSVYAYENIVQVLRHINDTCGPSSSRHDDERVYVIKAPGDKNEKFTDIHSQVIWGDDND